MSIFKRSLLTLFGIIISGLLIAWIVYFLQNLSGQSGTVSFLLNLSLVLVVLMLVYKTINVELPGKSNSKKDSFFSLILNLILYIPCALSGVCSSGVKTATGDNSEIINPNGITAGVAQSLIATAGGLIIAIFSLIAFNFFSRKQALIIEDFERLGTKIIDHIKLDSHQQ